MVIVEFPAVACGVSSKLETIVLLMEFSIWDIKSYIYQQNQVCRDAVINYF